MKIAVGSDHCGFLTKKKLMSFLEQVGYECIDFGCDSTDPVDFPDIAREVCNSIQSGDCQRGIMFCGTGVGAAIAANKMYGIRAAVCHDYHSAHQAVEHDDVNVLCIGAQIIGPWLIQDILVSFLEASFSTEEHFQRRVKKLNELEQQSTHQQKGT